MIPPWGLDCCRGGLTPSDRRLLEAKQATVHDGISLCRALVIDMKAPEGRKKSHSCVQCMSVFDFGGAK